MKKIIETLKAPKPLGPYNQAVVCKDTIYVSGQIGLDPLSEKLQNQNITTETTQVMNNLTAILEDAGYALNDVVKCSIFVKNMKPFFN